MSLGTTRLRGCLKTAGRETTEPEEKPQRAEEGTEGAEVRILRVPSVLCALLRPLCPLCPLCPLGPVLCPLGPVLTFDVARSSGTCASARRSRPGFGARNLAETRATRWFRSPAPSLVRRLERFAVALVLTSLGTVSRRGLSASRRPAGRDRARRARSSRRVGRPARGRRCRALGLRLPLAPPELHEEPLGLGRLRLVEVAEAPVSALELVAH